MEGQTWSRLTEQHQTQKSYEHQTMTLSRSVRGGDGGQPLLQNIWKTTIQKFDDPDNPNYKEIEIELETDPETGGVTYNEASVRPDAEGKLKDVEEYIDDLDLEDMKKYTYDE